MLLEVGIMMATYLTVRASEEESQDAESRRRQRFQEDEDALELGREDGLVVGRTRTKTPTREERHKELQHYSKMSAVTIGVTALGSMGNPLFGLFGLALYIYTVIPYMRDVEYALRVKKKVDVNVLFFLADTLTFATGRYVTASLGVFLMHSGKMSVEKAKDMAEKMIKDVFGQLPTHVWKIGDDGKEVFVSLEDVQKGDLVIIDTGDTVPVDGVISDGFAMIDQHALTGESQPVDKSVGDAVLAATLVVSGRIFVEVQEAGAETKVAQVSEILLKATDHKSMAQLKGERWADEATLPMLGAAALMLPLMGPVPTAVFINSHIGNRIRIVAPLITLNHISKASEMGVLVKDGRAIETLSTIDTVLFDKTGTLTEDVPENGHIYTCKPFSEMDILRYAAAAERKFAHPIARAILKKADECGIELPDISDAEYKVGYGITVNVDGHVVQIGSGRFVEELGIELPPAMAAAQADVNEKGFTLILVVVDNRVGGGIELRPRVRPDALTLVDELRSLGITHTAIVSGDHAKPTRALAEQLGVDDWYAQTLPEDKSRIVAELQAEGRKVCFIGDGINDAIAMKQADVSMSICGSTAIATDMAEVIFMDGTMSRMCDLIRLAKRLDEKLNRALNLTLIPGVFNLSGAFLFNYSVMTSLVVNTLFASVGLKDALLPVDDFHPTKQSTDDGENPEVSQMEAHPVSSSASRMSNGSNGHSVHGTNGVNGQKVKHEREVEDVSDRYVSV